MDPRLFPLLETRQNFFLRCSAVTPLLMFLDTCCLTFNLGLTDLTHLNITNKMVPDVIVTLDPSKATDPDEIPVVLLQKCSPELSPILCRLFKKCIAESCFPSCWNLASLVPVFKTSGKRSDPRNYRPISLLSIISKVFESLINSCITHHQESINLFLIVNMDFVLVGPLLRLELSSVSMSINLLMLAVKPGRLHLTFLRQVWHAGLLHKMKSNGISGEVFNIIKTFSSGRKMKVVLDGYFSNCYSIISGALQGSFLGPTLFLIFINDLLDSIVSKLAIYADGTTLYSSLGKTADVSDKVEMAAD